MNREQIKDDMDMLFSTYFKSWEEMCYEMEKYLKMGEVNEYLVYLGIIVDAITIESSHSLNSGLYIMIKILANNKISSTNLSDFIDSTFIEDKIRKFKIDKIIA